MNQPRSTVAAGPYESFDHGTWCLRGAPCPECIDAWERDDPDGARVVPPSAPALGIPSEKGSTSVLIDNGQVVWTDEKGSQP